MKNSRDHEIHLHRAYLNRCLTTSYIEKIEDRDANNRDEGFAVYSVYSTKDLTLPPGGLPIEQQAIIMSSEQY